MLDALLLLSYRCIVTIHGLLLFLTVRWVGLQYVIVVFPDHTHLLFGIGPSLYLYYMKPHSKIAATYLALLTM